MTSRLHGKRCLIVGAGGVGMASAALFRAEGARVVLADRTPASAEVLACDATDAAAVAALFQETVQRLGGLDVLFHVAGRSSRSAGDGSLHLCSDEGWTDALAHNATSAFLTNRAAVSYFLSQGQGGTIVNMASVLASSPSPRFFDTCGYAAAKGAVIALTLEAAARYAADGIRVNVLAPGLIDTPMAARALQNPAIVAFLRTKQPLVGGPVTADDVAQAALFLASDAARALTGVVLPVDAGWRLSDGQYGQGPAAGLE